MPKKTRGPVSVLFSVVLDKTGRAQRDAGGGRASEPVSERAQGSVLYDMNLTFSFCRPSSPVDKLESRKGVRLIFKTYTYQSSAVPGTVFDIVVVSFLVEGIL